MKGLILCLLLSGCAIKDESLIIANELIVVKMEDNRPRVRLATGLEECKWRARGNIQEGEYEALFLCSIKTDRLNPYD
ncbi:hypothetical protein VPHD51_0106 [Vibrio phage D51]